MYIRSDDVYSGDGTASVTEARRITEKKSWLVDFVYCNVVRWLVCRGIWHNDECYVLLPLAQ
jgi:hypothetical protein